MEELKSLIKEQNQLLKEQNQLLQKQCAIMVDGFANLVSHASLSNAITPTTLPVSEVLGQAGI